MCYLVILDEDSDEDVVIAKEDPIHVLFSDSDSESIRSDF